jgi:far upstream element-binding protein
VPGKGVRNVFVEGTPERFDHAKRLIEEIVFEARRLNKTQSASSFSHNVSINAEVNPFPGPHIPYPIPNTLTGLIIGKNGETIKQLHNRCGAYVFIPKNIDSSSHERILELSGTEEQIDRAKKEIQKVLNNAAYIKNIQHRDNNIGN